MWCVSEQSAHLQGETFSTSKAAAKGRANDLSPWDAGGAKLEIELVF
jgi:hypothetical protein